MTTQQSECQNTPHYDLKMISSELLSLLPEYQVILQTIYAGVKSYNVLTLCVSVAFLFILASHVLLSGIELCIK